VSKAINGPRRGYIAAKPDCRRVEFPERELASSLAQFLETNARLRGVFRAVHWLIRVCHSPFSVLRFSKGIMPAFIAFLKLRPAGSGPRWSRRWSRISQSFPISITLSMTIIAIAYPYILLTVSLG
jgi:hypothetical protein